MTTFDDRDEDDLTKCPEINEEDMRYKNRRVEIDKAYQRTQPRPHRHCYSSGIFIDTNNTTTNGAIRLWGDDAQTRILQEECAELISAISRYSRKRTDTTPVSEEVADVIVSMMSVIPALGIEGEVKKFVDLKIGRLDKRMEQIFKKNEDDL